MPPSKPPEGSWPAFASLPELIENHAAHTPRGAALVKKSESVPWAELAARERCLAENLRLSGVRKGHRIGMLLDDPIEFVVSLAGALRCGAIAVPLPAWMNSPTIRMLLGASRSRWLIAQDSDPRTKDILNDQCVLLTPTRLAEPVAATDPRTPGIDGIDLATILYSSGTTSIPKGVVHDHRGRYATQLRFIRRFGVSRDTVTLVATPLYTSLTWASLLPTLAAGGSCVFLPEFDTENFFSLAESFRANLTMMVPAQYKMIAEDRRASPSALARFDYLITAGARTEPSLRETMFGLTKGRFIDLLGSTETDAMACSPTAAPPGKMGSVGVPFDDVDMRVIDEEQRELPRDTQGEIVAHSPSLMVCYDGAPEQTANAFWASPTTGLRYYRTGDIGRIDDEGYLWVTSRRKDVIVSGGFKIYPDDIEQILLTHEAIREAAVVGVPVETFGEVPLAFVVVRQGAPSTSEICRWANRRLNSNQRLSAVEVITALPRNASGKVMKDVLAEKAALQYAAKSSTTRSTRP